MFCQKEHLYNGIYERSMVEIPHKMSAHIAHETRLKYLRLDELAQQEDIWDDQILVKIPKAGSIPDMDYYAFQCFLADFKGIAF